jgi:hypothetical protein
MLPPSPGGGPPDPLEEPLPELPLPEPLSDPPSEPLPEPLPDPLPELLPEPLPEPLLEPLPDPLPEPLLDPFPELLPNPMPPLSLVSPPEAVPRPRPLSPESTGVVPFAQAARSMAAPAMRTEVHRGDSAARSPFVFPTPTEFVFDPMTTFSAHRHTACARHAFVPGLSVRLRLNFLV